MPAAEIFGSEAFSRQSDAIAALMPPPYVDLHPATAASLKVSAGETVTVSWNTQRIALQVRLNDSVPEQAGVVPARYPETRHLQAPVVAQLQGGGA